MKTNSILFILGIALNFSCSKDIIVEDIKGKSINIITPKDNFVTNSNKLVFWWEELNGAEKYRLQIVKPTFSLSTQIICDTSISKNKFEFTLEPGNYQWRIRAENIGGATTYQNFNLTVDTTSNLGNLLVSVIEPTNGFLTGSKNINFSWNSLNTARKYQILIMNSVGGIVKDTITNNNNYRYTFLTQGTYNWKVRALNDFSVSQYNTPIFFTIDLTPPIAPLPTSPLNGAIVNYSANLTWNRLGTPDAKYDSLFIATDSLFSNNICALKVYSQLIQIGTINPQLPINNGFYWWRLRSVDSVGNRSIFSNQLKFKLN